MPSAVAFAKMHGLGNDFVMLDAPPDESALPDLARAMCDRHFGIGGDGLIACLPSEKADVRMRMFNPDGSEAEMCGNGIRCLAGYLRDRFPGGAAVETLAGVLRARFEGTEVDGEGLVSIDMGAPRLDRAQIPMSGGPEGHVLREPLQVDGHDYEISCVSMGNPHCVLFLDSLGSTPLHGQSLAEAPLEAIGRRIGSHPAFPQGTNVELVSVEGRDRLGVRVWERGAGATLACGTGACAAMVAAFLTGRVGRRADVRLPGGTLRVEWDGEGPVVMTGPYQWVFRGEWLGSRGRQAAYSI